MSVRSGSGGRRSPAIKSSMYFAGTATASASSSGDRPISCRRRRRSSATVPRGLSRGDDVMKKASSSLVPEGDAPAGQVIWRYGERDPVAGEHADAEASHLAGNGGEHVVAVRQVDAKS